ncbi:hypothetical protein SAMN05661080_05065 [Modestobacter sp. DSM 44400]|nr:hypothetical protein SAMN05661080_05065 [Modestobacter sp. DSM 44400]
MTPRVFTCNAADCNLTAAGAAHLPLPREPLIRLCDQHIAQWRNGKVREIQRDQGTTGQMQQPEVIFS